jgi:transposase InsO family protein
VVGWAVEEHMRADLVQTALMRAITMRGQLPGQVIFHSDRGTRYTSQQLTCTGQAPWTSEAPTPILSTLRT